MLKILAASFVLIGAAAQAQPVTSYKSSTPSAMKGDPDKIVCQKEEKIGTRLGAKKVCLKISEWEALARDHRVHTERLQSVGCVGGAEGCPLTTGKIF